MLVQSHGRVLSFGNLKGLIVTAAILLCISAAAGAVLVLRYIDLGREKLAMQQAISEAQERIDPLRDERDMLIAKLSISGAKVKLLRSEKQRRTAGREEGGAAEADDGVGASTSSAASTGTNRVPSTAVEGLKLFYDPDRREVEVEFRLVNILESHDPVSGFIFVVFQRSREEDPPLALPAVNLIAGRPADIDRGRYFIISNFNIIRFKTIVQSSPERYRSVTVFIYGSKGELLLEEAHPIVVSAVSSGHDS